MQIIWWKQEFFLLSVCLFQENFISEWINSNETNQFFSLFKSWSLLFSFCPLALDSFVLFVIFIPVVHLKKVRLVIIAFTILVFFDDFKLLNMHFLVLGFPFLFIKTRFCDIKRSINKGLPEVQILKVQLKRLFQSNVLSSRSLVSVEADHKHI